MSSVKACDFLVTGGTGFIGSALVRRLVDDGHSVRVLDNGFRGNTERLAGYLDKLELVEGDIRSAQVARDAVRNVKNVVHMAAINGTKHFYEIPDQVLSVGVEGTLRVLEASRESDVESFFFASSSEVYQTPPSVPTDESVPMCIPDTFNPRYSYGGSKLIGELLTANYGRDRFRTVIFRPHNIYGANMGFEHVVPDFILRILKTAQGNAGDRLEFPIQGDGSETRAFCYVDDFINGLITLCDKAPDQSLYHIGTNEEISIVSLATTLAEVMGHEIDIVPGDRRAGGTLRRCPDISKIEALGYTPEWSLKDGLARCVEWYSSWYEKNL